MDCSFFGLEAKKAEAMKRFNNRSISFRDVLLFVEFVAVVALLGWYFPAVTFSIQMVTDLFQWISSVIRNHFIVFTIVNALIVLILISSRNSSETKPDLYDEYYSSSAVVAPVAVNTPAYHVTEVEDDFDSNREIVPSIQAVTVAAAKETSDRRVVCCEAVKETSDRRVVCCEAVSDGRRQVVCCEAVKEVKSKSYRRTRSEKNTTEKVNKVEYRRTESEKVTTAWRSQKMDGLSNEEFRMTVETFITEKRKSLFQQKDVVQRRKGVVQWQNGAVECDRPRHQNRRLVGSSGSTGSDSGSWLAISN